MRIHAGRTLLAVGVAALVCAASLAQSERASAIVNLLTNPTFDADVSGWSLGGGSALNTLTFNASEDANGTPPGAAEVHIKEQAQFSWVDILAQCVPVSAGLTYAASGETRIPNTGTQWPNAQVSLSLFFYPGNNCDGSFLSNSASAQAGVSDLWQSLSVSAQAPAGSNSVLFRFNFTGNKTANEEAYAFFDNAALTASGTPFTPTSTATKTPVVLKTHTPTPQTPVPAVTATPSGSTPAATATAPAVASATSPSGGAGAGGLRPPDTGSGPASGADAPWQLMALLGALGSSLLLAGGALTRARRRAR